MFRCLCHDATSSTRCTSPRLAAITTGYVTAGFGVRMVHCTHGSKKIVPVDMYHLQTAPAKDDNRRKSQSSQADPTFPTANLLFTTPLTQNMFINMLCGYPLQHNTHSSTRWILSSHLLRHTSPTEVTQCRVGVR